jgi:hypothetical protein
VILSDQIISHHAQAVFDAKAEDSPIVVLFGGLARAPTIIVGWRCKNISAGKQLIRSCGNTESLGESLSELHPRNSSLF